MQTSLVVCLAFATVLATSLGAAILGDDKCHSLDCPSYTVLNKTSSWELRHYPEIQWAATNATGPSREAVNDVLFHLLFDYISGENVQKTKIPMTTPVLTIVAHGQGPTCASTFTMHFMIPLAQQAAPISPSDSHVYITSTPPQDVFVRSFSGFAKDADYQENLEELTKDVSAIAKVDTAYFDIASYDGPYQFHNRHNEVWLVKV